MTRGVLGPLLVSLTLAAGLVVAQAPPRPAADPPAASPLPECDRLKAENLKLRAQVLELQRMVAQTQLDRETAALEADRQRLEAAFRVLLKPTADEVFDWQTLAFKPPAAAAPSGNTKP